MVDLKKQDSLNFFQKTDMVFVNNIWNMTMQIPHAEIFDTGVRRL